VTCHLEANVPPSTRLSVAPADHGARPAHIEPDHFALQAAAEALRAVYGVQPLVVRMGGTVPITELFERHMGLGTVFVSFSTADEDYHAPNEFFRLHRLHEGLEARARLWKIGVLRCRLVECYPCLWTTLLPMSLDYTRPTANRACRRGEGFALELVGASHYRRNFDRVCGNTAGGASNMIVQAVLVCERDNQHDPDASESTSRDFRSATSPGQCLMTIFNGKVVFHAGTVT
jgi:hypothetical protein